MPIGISKCLPECAVLPTLQSTVDNCPQVFESFDSFMSSYDQNILSLL